MSEAALEQLREVTLGFVVGGVFGFVLRGLFR
jgi:hypothetical protein